MMITSSLFRDNHCYHFTIDFLVFFVNEITDVVKSGEHFVYLLCGDLHCSFGILRVFLC